MRSFIECIPCMFSQAIRSARMVGLDDASIHDLVTTIGGQLCDFDPALSPPVNARVVYSALGDLCGLSDPFEQAKHRHTELAISLIPTMQRWLAEADDKLDASARIAAAGNILDLGATFEHTAKIRTVLFHRGFPVDIRHNVKIGRRELGEWATAELRRG